MMLLVFMVLTMTVTSAAVGMVIANSLAASKLEQGEDAHAIAQSGVEETLLRLLRNDAYSGGTLTIGDGNATVSVAGNNPIVVSSVGSTGTFKRTVQVGVTVTNMIMSMSSWQEVP